MATRPTISIISDPDAAFRGYLDRHVRARSDVRIHLLVAVWLLEHHEVARDEDDFLVELCSKTVRIWCEGGTWHTKAEPKHRRITFRHVLTVDLSSPRVSVGCATCGETWPAERQPGQSPRTDGGRFARRGNLY